MKSTVFAWVLVVALTGTIPCGALEKPQRFPFAKALVTGKGATSSIGAFELDEQMWALLDARLNNMRIFDDQGLEIPCLGRVRQERREVAQEVQVNLNTLKLEILKGNRMRVDYGTPESAPVPGVSALVIHSGCRDFEKHVTVLGSSDGEKWVNLEEDCPIFDYSRFMDVRNFRVDIGSPGQFRFLRLEISNITESKQSPWVNMMRETRGAETAREAQNYSLVNEDFRIDRVTFLERRTVSVVSRDVSRAYTIRNLAVEQDQDRQATLVSFETDRCPLRSIALQVSSGNFSRPVRVEGTDDMGEKPAWQTVASATIARVSTGGYRQEQTVIPTVADTRWSRYRLSILNHDNPPITIDGVTVTGAVHEVLFFHDPDRLYEVYYGGKDVPAPSYDIATVLGGKEQAGATAFLLCQQEPNPTYDPRQPRTSGVTGKRVMVVVTILAAAMLIWLVTKAAKQVKLP